MSQLQIFVDNRGWNLFDYLGDHDSVTLMSVDKYLHANMKNYEIKHFHLTMNTLPMFKIIKNKVKSFNKITIVDVALSVLKNVNIKYLYIRRNNNVMVIKQFEEEKKEIEYEEKNILHIKNLSNHIKIIRIYSDLDNVVVHDLPTELKLFSMSGSVVNFDINQKLPISLVNLSLFCNYINELPKLPDGLHCLCLYGIYNEYVINANCKSLKVFDYYSTINTSNVIYLTDKVEKVMIPENATVIGCDLSKTTISEPIELIE